MGKDSFSPAPVALSPRPNPPGPGSISKAQHPKPKALAILNATASSPVPSGTSTPADPSMDLGAQMNDQVRRQYVIGKNIGSGTYADVFLAHDRSKPSKLYAIKRIKLNKEWKDGITMDAIREIKFLSELHHPNIINLEAVFSTLEQNISLVLEHLPLGDLEEMWRKHSIPYTPADIKSWMLMLSQAIWFCHENRVLHRDIKSNNLLIASDGTLKLADFGLARSFADPGRAMTHQVITRYYRPPELLYAARHYSGKVDVWSVGCVFAELVIRNFFVPGDSDIHQLSLIYDFGGHPTEETWPGVTSLPSYFPPEKLAKKPQPMMYWRQKFSLIGDSGIDLLRGMLTMDPKKRLSARQVLEHKYWTDAPKPTKVTDLPRRPDEKKMGDDLKRRPGELDNGRGDKVARKLDFGAMRK